MARILWPDLSDHQPNVDLTALTRWQRSQFGIAFVGLKATEGIDYTSSRFKARWQQLDHLAEVRLAYHFAHVGEKGHTAKGEADHFFNVVHDAGVRRTTGKADVFCLDAEQGTLSPRESRLWMGDFLSHLDARTHALAEIRPAWVYGGAGWLYDHLSPGKVDRYLWVASYTSEEYARDHIPAEFSWKPSLFVAHQFTDGSVGPLPHTIPGVGASDLSHFQGGKDRLRSVAGVR